MAVLKTCCFTQQSRKNNKILFQLILNLYTFLISLFLSYRGFPDQTLILYRVRHKYQVCSLKVTLAYFSVNLLEKIYSCGVCFGGISVVQAYVCLCDDKDMDDSPHLDSDCYLLPLLNELVVSSIIIGKKWAI